MTIRPPINLEYIGVPVGATLTLADKEDVSVVVVRQYPPRVAYEEQVLSLNQAAKRAYDTPDNETIQATLYWRYEGESLWDRRMRFEKHHNSRFQDSYRKERSTWFRCSCTFCEVGPKIWTTSYGVSMEQITKHV